MDDIHMHAKKFLSDPSFNPNICNEKSPTITLTFAQSLDGKIAKVNKQLLLSGKESMAMTHRLRTQHDGIMVGIGTVLCDNPRLSAREIPPDEMGFIEQPRPIILDTNLRTPLDSNLLTGPKKDSRLKSPWVITGPKHDIEKEKDLERCGARVIVVDECADNGWLKLDGVFSAIHSLGIKRLMIEGGAQVIQQVLMSGLVDRLIITIAPVLVGSNSVAAVSSANGIPGIKICPLKYETFGNDVVMVASCQNTSGKDEVLGEPGTDKEEGEGENENEMLVW